MDNFIDTISKNGQSLKSQMSKGICFRKVVSNYLVLAVFVISVSFISCNKPDDDTIQLLDMMIFPDVVLDYICDQVDPAVKYTKYNYDKQNRITKISSYNKSETLVCTETFTYRD